MRRFFEYLVRRAEERRGHHEKTITMHYKALWPLTKMANRKYRGFPVATVAFYGPDDRRASKVAVGIVERDGGEATHLERWFSESADVRDDSSITKAILEFVERHRAMTIVLSDRIIGCPHEEGIDYPLDETCPQCPFWANRDRYTGAVLPEP
jgi:hypothetical protein